MKTYEASAEDGRTFRFTCADSTEQREELFWTITVEMFNRKSDAPAEPLFSNKGTKYSTYLQRFDTEADANDAARDNNERWFSYVDSDEEKQWRGEMGFSEPDRNDPWEIKMVVRIRRVRRAAG